MGNLHSHLNILCALTKFRENLIFCGLCKKTKKILGKQPFLTPNFVFLTHDTKNVGFREMAL
jgi:hypothetical protein